MRCDSTALAPAPLSPPLYQSSLAPGFAPVVRLTSPLLPPRARRPPTPAHHPQGLAGQTCVLCTIGPPSLSTRTHSFFTRQPARPPTKTGSQNAGRAPALFYDKDQQASGVGAASRARPPSSSSLSPPHPRPPCAGELHQRPTTKCVKSITKLYCKIFINIKFFFPQVFNKARQSITKCWCVLLFGAVSVPPPLPPPLPVSSPSFPPTSPCPRGASAGGPVGGGFPLGSKPSVSSPYSPWPAGASPAGAGAPCSRDHGWRDRRPWKSSAPTRVPWSKSMLPTGVIQRLFHSDAGGVG